MMSNSYRGDTQAGIERLGAQFEVIFPGIRITIRKRNNFDLRNRY